jgi:hypothetical protein
VLVHDYDVEDAIDPENLKTDDQGNEYAEAEWEAEDMP